jgi:DNA-binding LacI/PurR family transcriptional regulator
MITGPMEEDCSCDRAEGYRRAIQKAGLTIDQRLIIEGDWAATSGQVAIHALAERGCMPTAVFAQNDRMAMGVLRAAREMDLDVPNDLAVIGVDDMPLSSYFDPPLTTMHQDMSRIGKEATHILLNLVRRVEQPVCHLKLSAQLILRQSTLEINQGGETHTKQTF